MLSQRSGLLKMGVAFLITILFYAFFKLILSCSLLLLKSGKAQTHKFINGEFQKVCVVYRLFFTEECNIIKIKMLHGKIKIFHHNMFLEEKHRKEISRNV